MWVQKNPDGFSVVELLIAIGLFGMIIPSIYLSIVSINGVNDRSADLTYANIIAENKIESLRSAGYNSLVDGSTDFSSELPSTFTAPRDADYIISSPSTGLKRIDIEIEYTDRGTTRTLNYSSVMSELGVAQ